MTGGRRVDPYLIEKIETTRGDVIYQRAEYEPARVYSRDMAETMTAMMAEVIRSGTGKAAAVDRWPVAGKTGTSQSSRDAWFVGYSSELLGGVWTGNDDDTPMNEVTGGGLPARLWSDMMKVAHDGRSPSLLRGADKLIQLTPEQQGAGGILSRSRHGLRGARWQHKLGRANKNERRVIQTQPLVVSFVSVRIWRSDIMAWLKVATASGVAAMLAMGTMAAGPERRSGKSDSLGCGNR